MPRRWTDLDSDEYRLPEGFIRIGYDADERRYYFRDGEGQTWRSEPGNQYGVLTPVRPEPPVTIPRRPPPPDPKVPIDDPPPMKSASAFKTFQGILNPRQITSASSTPRRSHTINIPSVALLRRSSKIAASFVRSRGKYFTKSEHSQEPLCGTETQQPSNSTHHRRVVSSPVTLTSTTAHVKGEIEPSVEPAETLKSRRGRETAQGTK